MTEYNIYDSALYLEMPDDKFRDYVRMVYGMDENEPVNDLWGYRRDIREMEEYDFFVQCEDVHGEFLVIADLGLWYGRRLAWKFCSTLSDAIRACVDGMDEFKIVEDGRGKVVLYGYHHDGTNVYEIRKVTGEISSATSEKQARKHSRNAHLRHEFGWI